jgi:hypothetical protein
MLTGEDEILKKISRISNPAVPLVMLEGPEEVTERWSYSC